MPRAQRSPQPRASWSAALTALREARGVTQDGWAALLGVGRATVQRWERGQLVPSAAAEAAILRVCAESGIFRVFHRPGEDAPRLTPDAVRELLARARLEHRPSSALVSAATFGRGARTRPADAGGSSIDAPERQPGSPERGWAAQDAPPPGNLNIPFTSFVGRERELAEVRRFLGEVRLLTLIGVGGIGKTRLALRAASLVTDREHGVWLVDLAPLTTGEHVVQAVAVALGVCEEPGRLLRDALSDHLRGRALLLVLDNCERATAACASMAVDLLAACPGLTILATSREPLGVPGEHLWRVPPLSLPPAVATTPPRAGGAGRAAARAAMSRLESLLRSESMQLFCERARTARPGFTLTDDNASVVAQLCRRLDGLPLALELAAARVKALSVEQIAERLDSRFALLATGPNRAAARHQTLRAVMDWSHELLTEPERVLFRRLSVFRGSFGIEASEAVAGPDLAGAPGEARSAPPEPAHLDTLEQLMDRSLLLVEEEGGQARYRMLETVRAYAGERLEDAGEAQELRRRHVEWYRAFAVRTEPLLRGSEQQAALDRLEREHDNLRAALAWSVADPAAATAGLQTAAALRLFWFLRGYPSEGREWLDRTLARAHNAPPAVRAHALDGAGALAHSQGDLAAAGPLLEEALALWRGVGDTRGLAVTQNTLGIVAKDTGDLEGAREWFERSLAAMRASGNVPGEATVLNNLASVAIDRGDYAAAIAYSEQSLARKRQLGDRMGAISSLHNLGEAARYLGDLGQALAWLQESLAISRELGASPRVAQTLHSIALIHLRLGDEGAAVAALRESAATFEQLGHRAGMVLCVEALAEAVASSAPELSARLLGAAAAQREAMNAPLPPADLAERERLIERLRERLTEGRFTAARTSGRVMPLERALAEALDAAERPAG